MPSLNDVVRDYTDLVEDDLAWLHLLVADWQIIADLSFADLLLWVPDREGHGFWAAAQMRPTTGPTAYVDDMVGSFIPMGRRPLLDAAYTQQRIAREGDPEWRDEVPVRVETIPVRRGDKVLGVVARNTNLLGVRTPSRLELSYLQTATDLARMISEGSFPVLGGRSELTDSPRVGDGFVRLDSSAVVTYASPNAQSAYRRLGLAADLVGRRFPEVTAALLPSSDVPVEESLQPLLCGQVQRETELAAAEAALIVRSIPLRPGGEHIGALLLTRDVTELRSRERELLSKEATIREIHHRVKNNLQTVAALLRLQARRIGVPEGRAALEEAERRVGSIAVVHDMLSQTSDERVDFDTVADRLRDMAADLASPGAQLRTERVGSFGTVAAEVATSLAIVLTELMQNAVEHGFGESSGRLWLRVTRTPVQLEVHVDDDGSGLPDDFDLRTATSLGMSIVSTLVVSELGGEIGFGDSPEAGARLTVTLPLRPTPTPRRR